MFHNLCSKWDIRSKCAWSCCVCRIYNVLNLTTLTCAYSITASLYVILNWILTIRVTACMPLKFSDDNLCVYILKQWQNVKCLNHRWADALNNFAQNLNRLQYSTVSARVCLKGTLHPRTIATHMKALHEPICWNDYSFATIIFRSREI